MVVKATPRTNTQKNPYSGQKQKDQPGKLDFEIWMERV